MLLRSWLAKGTMLDETASKSRSKPSMMAEPKGRLTELLVCWGPNMAQMVLAHVVASVLEVKPPSV